MNPRTSSVLRVFYREYLNIGRLASHAHLIVHAIYDCPRAKGMNRLFFLCRIKLSIHVVHACHAKPEGSGANSFAISGQT